MDEILGDLPYVLVYLDDILIVNKNKESVNDHMNKIQNMHSHLDNVGFAVNLRKSFFMKTEREYLRYILTPYGLKPQPKKVEAIQWILPP